MKIKAITLILAIASVFCQSCAAQNPFKTLSDMNGVESVFVGGALLKMAGNISVGHGIPAGSIKSLKSVGVYNITEPCAMEEARRLVSDYVVKNKLDTLMMATDWGDSTMILGRVNGDFIDSPLIVTDEGGFEMNVILLQGNINVNQLSGIAGLQSDDDSDEDHDSDD